MESNLAAGWAALIKLPGEIYLDVTRGDLQYGVCCRMQIKLASGALVRLRKADGDEMRADREHTRERCRVRDKFMQVFHSIVSPVIDGS